MKARLPSVSTSVLPLARHSLAVRHQIKLFLFLPLAIFQTTSHRPQATLPRFQQLPVSRALSYPSNPLINFPQGSLQLPESNSPHNHLSLFETTVCSQPQTCLLPSTTSPTTWPVPASTSLLASLPATVVCSPVPLKVVGCTSGTSPMRPLRGSSRSSSRVSMCKF